MEHFYKQPKYFSKFRCIGGKCPESCCDGWEVNWKKEEIDKLNSIECSERLKELINSSFELQKNGYYNIKLGGVLSVNANDRVQKTFLEKAVCPFHDLETGLCDIQKELGEKYLGIVCRQYPRHYIETGNQVLRWCTTSCPAVIDILLDNEDALDIENVIARDYGSLDKSTVTVDTGEALRSDPIRRLRTELFDFYTGMLLDKSRDIDISIILTALAIKHFTDAESKGRFNDIPNIIKAMTKQLNDSSVVKSIQDIKPNYQLKFKLVNNMLVKHFGERTDLISISALHDGQELVTERYIQGLDNFSKAFDDNKYILKNVIMNSFFDINMPLGKLKRPLLENYAYFVLAAASFITVAAAIGYTGESIREKFKICVAEMSRSFSHSINKADEITEEIKNMGLTTPAHLALIIKG